MSASSVLRLLAIVLVLPGAALAGIEVRHQALDCVPSERYTRIVASGAPAEGVARAELQFRVRPDAPWYGVPMTADGAAWSAMLPRPVPSLARFEYRVVMTARDLASSETPTVAVRVAAEGSACESAAESSTAVSAPIVVRVPLGAPLVPPVPAGFSPAGIVAAQEPAQRGPWKAKWLAATGLAGGLAGAAALVRADSAFDPHGDDLSIEFVGYERGVGRVRPLAAPDLLLAMRVSGGPAIPLTLLWHLEWQSPDLGVTCVTTGGIVSVDAAPRPVTVTLATPLTASPACGERFRVDRAHVTVTREGQLLFDDTLAMLYTFQR